MPQLWRHDEREWTAVGLDDLESGTAAIRPAADGFGGTWMLLASLGDAVVVNGEPLRTGLLALRDRDEIRFANGARFFFSMEDVATVEVVADAALGLRCPRCCRPFESGVAVVRCPRPGCGVLHHQTDALPCWTHGARCAVCPQPTALDEAQCWTPEAL